MDAASAKKTKGVPAAASALPDDIVEDILAGLPVKSLLRFRCVSRSWRYTITSRAFRDLHSQRAGRGRRLFIRPPGYCKPFYACPPSGGPVEEIMSPYGFPQSRHVFPITNSCHGLVLLRCLEYLLHYVWNPSTGEIVTLPDRIPFKTVGYGPRPFVSYGMGFCSVTNKHKVVRVYWLGEPRNAAVCEVFTLNESTHWRPVATQPPAVWRLRVRGSQGGVFCNGNVHFVGQDGTITAFDVTNETFGTLMPPLELKDHIFNLTELDGCLCAYFSCISIPRPEEPYKIWVLRDYMTKGRWEKVRCVEFGNMTEAERESWKCDWIAPLAVYHDGTAQATKIMFGTDSCKVFVVDPSNGAPEILFSLDGVRGKSQFPTMGLFEESLESVGRTSEDIILSAPSARAWYEVLSLLPAHVVGRMNQVCKKWRAIIQSEYFAHAHLHRANQNRSLRVMFTNGKPKSFKSVESFINSSDTPPLVDDDSRVVCSKPCHGLNGGSFTYYDFVCNPVTDYYKAIPIDNSCKELRGFSLLNNIAHRQSDYSGNAMFAGRFGLGYDVEMCTHVLVRLTYKERNVATRDYKLECEIRYIEDTDWDELDPPSRPIANMPPAYSNGKLYWMVDTQLWQISSSHEIIALDVSTREFEVLEGPPCCHDNNERVSIVELQGMVCVACSRQRTSTIEIWAMKDTSSWSLEYYIELKRFSSEYSSELVTPLDIDPKDGRILLSTGKALGYYDPKTVELETIYRLGKHVEGKKFIPILFQESLVNPCDAIFY